MLVAGCSINAPGNESLNHFSEWEYIEIPYFPATDYSLPEDPDNVAGIIAFTATYKEDAALKCCKDIRRISAANDIPLLIAINMYQLPLGNSVKKLPRSDFILTPLNKDELILKLKRIDKSI